MGWIRKLFQRKEPPLPEIPPEPPPQEAHKDEVLEKEVREATKVMSQALGVPIYRLPDVYIWDKEETASCENGRRQIILSPKDLRDPKRRVDTIGEEVAHYIREMVSPISLNPKRVEHLYVHEFFGFLGSRLYRKLQGVEDSRTPWERKKAMQDLRENRRIRRKNLTLYSKREGEKRLDSEFQEKYDKAKKYLKDQRHSILIHQRPYEFARGISLEYGRRYGEEKYQNLGRLFYEDDPDIRRALFKKEDKRGLEKAVAFISGLLLFGGIIRGISLTGNVVGTGSLSDYSFIGVLLGALGLFFVFFRNKRKNFRGKQKLYAFLEEQLG